MAYNLLKGKKGIIFGALNDRSIAWKIAERAHSEGAQILLTNTPVAMRLGEVDELAKTCNTIVIPADATNLADQENLISCCIPSVCHQTLEKAFPMIISIMSFI